MMSVQAPQARTKVMHTCQTGASVSVVEPVHLSRAADRPDDRGGNHHRRRRDRDHAASLTPVHTDTVTGLASMQGRSTRR